MTRHATIFPITRRAAVAVALAVGLVLSGCSVGVSSAGTSTPTATPTLDPHAIAAEIAATFPTEEELLKSYETGSFCVAEAAGSVSSCGGDAWQVAGAMSNGFTLRDGVTDVTAGALVLSIVEHETNEEAQKQVDDLKALDILFDGDFDIAPGKDGTQAAGARGTGALIDFERDEWAGYRVSQVSDAIDFDGSTLGATTNTTSILMANGPLTFMLRVYWASTEPGVSDAEVNGWLDRVFGPDKAA